MSSGMELVYEWTPEGAPASTRRNIDLCPAQYVDPLLSNADWSALSQYVPRRHVFGLFSPCGLLIASLMSAFVQRDFCLLISHSTDTWLPVFFIYLSLSFHFFTWCAAVDHQSADLRRRQLVLRCTPVRRTAPRLARAAATRAAGTAEQNPRHPLG
jgi:hypothetical protein